MDIQFLQLSIASAVLLVYLFTKLFLHKIKNLPPSPILNLPILGHLYLLKKFPQVHRSLAKISDRHGPILLLHFGSRRVLLVSSPDAAEECLNKNDIIFANRPRLLAGKYIGCNYTSLAWASYGDHWRNLRRIASLEILSTHRLQLLHSIRVDEIKAMLQRVYKVSQASHNNVVDMKNMVFEMTLNVMMRMIAGKRYFSGDKVEDVHEYEQANQFKELVMETLQNAGSTNMGDFLPILRKLGSGGLENKLIKLHKKRDTFIQALIDEFTSKMDSETVIAAGMKKSLIEVMLSLRKTDPEYYTDEIIKGLMLVLLAAGTDGTVGNAEWALSLLLNNPEILKKAQNEIDDHVGQERLFEETDLAHLPYLRCIINETLRMFPIGPVTLPHESSEECKIGGYNIPKGTILIVNLWAIQNDPKIWEEPRTFKPERFEGLEGTRDGYKFMPFSSGRRRCPGEGLANRMVGLILGSLLQCFDLERPGKELVDMSEAPGANLPKAQPLKAKCRPRPLLMKLLSQ